MFGDVVSQIGGPVCSPTVLNCVCLLPRFIGAKEEEGPV